jgi:hypothetical protein
VLLLLCTGGGGGGGGGGGRCAAAAIEYYLSQRSSMQCGASNETIPIVYCRERARGENIKADEQVELLEHKYVTL